MADKLKPEDPAVVRNVDIDWLWKKLDVFFVDVQRIAASLDAIAKNAAPQTAPSTVAEIDLDAPVNDPEVKLEPTKGANKWTGESMRGKRFSECPADYLDRLALMFDYFAAHPKPGKEQFADAERLNAARARAWAKRNRTNGATSPSSGSTDFVD